MNTADSSEPLRKRTRRGSSKRTPYALAACDHCHSHKLKCSGDHPCERCRKHQIPCTYPIECHRLFDISADLLTHIDDLQLQLDTVKTHLQTLRSTSVPHHLPPPEDTSSRSPALVANGAVGDEYDHDPYAGPTSSTYSLRTAGWRFSSIPQPSVRHDTVPASITNLTGETLTSSIETQSHLSIVTLPEISIETLEIQSVRDCIQTFKSVFAVLHPLPRLEEIEAQSPQLLRAVKRSLQSQPSLLGQCGLPEMFKMIIAIATVCNEGCPTPLSRMLYDSVEPILGWAAFARTITHDFRILLLLVALYHFSCDDLPMSTRAIMIASRTAMEEGLYRKENLAIKYPMQQERKAVNNMLWSIFVLDFQFNYAAGLPTVMREDDIDLPRPTDSPYLSAMVEYVFLGAQAWTSIVNKDVLVDGQQPSQDALGFFQYQLLRWQERLHVDVRFDSEKFDLDPSILIVDGDSQDVYLKALLYLRSNQLQILVLRPILMHPRKANDSPALAEQAVSIARRSMRTLEILATKSQLYRKRQMIFNHFLGSSLAVLGF